MPKAIGDGAGVAASEAGAAVGWSWEVLAGGLPKRLDVAVVGRPVEAGGELAVAVDKGGVEASVAKGAKADGLPKGRELEAAGLLVLGSETLGAGEKMPGLGGAPQLNAGTTKGGRASGCMLSLCAAAVSFLPAGVEPPILKVTGL